MAKASFVISIISACLAIGSYFRGGRQWRRAGPELGFDLALIGYRHPGTIAVYKVVARMEVFADGRMPVHVRSAELCGPGSDWVRTDITSSGTIKLEPTESALSNAVSFDVPEPKVRAMLRKDAGDDFVSNEIVRSIVVDPVIAVKGRVRRGDGYTYTRPRTTRWFYKDEPWPVLPSGKVTE